MGIRNGWLTTSEYSASVGVTQQTVRQWAATGRLDSRRVGRRIEVRDRVSPDQRARAAAAARELERLLRAIDEELAAAHALVRELDPIAARFNEAADDFARRAIDGLARRSMEQQNSIDGLAKIADEGMKP